MITYSFTDGRPATGQHCTYLAKVVSLIYNLKEIELENLNLDFNQPGANLSNKNLRLAGRTVKRRRNNGQFEK